MLIGLVGVIGISANGWSAASTATTVLAGGCFWCVEHDFRQLAGVIEVIPGYSGGSRLNPTYDNYNDTDVAKGTPHVEVVQITYDPVRLSYDELLAFYFRHIDPTDGGGQFCDRGPAYRPVIFTTNDEESKAANSKKAEVAKLIAKPVAVEILPAGAFWPAEEYHQDYARKNPVRYKYYRWNCGRDKQIEKVWNSVLG